MAMPSGSATATAVGRGRQPVLVSALQRSASITETVLSTWFAVYRVCVVVLTAMASGSLPVWIVGGSRDAQAALWVPLQTRISMTDRVSSFWFATYRVCRGESIATQRVISKNMAGLTLTVPGVWPAQPVRSPAWQVLPSRTETVLSKLAAYTLLVSGSTFATLTAAGPAGSVPTDPQPD